MDKQEGLSPRHGGYRKLKSFQIAQLVYDVTVRFYDRYINKRSCTHDQMVQAARIGVQNIAEGSQASGTSKKTELKLTNVAQSSLEELKLDYEDFLRQRGLPQFEPEHSVLKRFKAMRCSTLDDVRSWVEKGLALMRKNRDGHGQTGTNTDTRRWTDYNDSSLSVGAGRCESMNSSVLVANAALSLLNLCCYFLDRQIAAQAKDFKNEGGFTEKLYRVRKAKRNKK